ncbi:hypothetical protein BJ878DRAFT_238959 [Calycina marina]|uniref:Uncharacterized protein n=1 Tax=Calycina marina TaxID=1763456 RepID=A0A9P7Z7K1_9HELO|nr:hypothetical protein BJ878DRAFT_238959 [Calycina marina]
MSSSCPSIGTESIDSWSGGKSSRTSVSELAEKNEYSSPKAKHQKKKQLPKKVSHKKPVRFHRQYHGKTKKWHENTETVVDDEPKPTFSRRFLEGRTRPSKLGGVDPFNALGLPNDSKTGRSLHHWTTVFQNTRMTINPRKNWFKINLSDATLLSVTNYCSTSHYFFCRGQRAPPTCLDQKVLAIRNINKTLQNPRAPITNYIIVGVSVMTILECLAGSVKECAIHRKGLQLMLQKMGGLRSLGFEGAAERTVSWADTCCAIFQRTKPTLYPLLIPDAGESLFSKQFDIGDLRERLLPLTNSEELAGDVLYVWLRLRYLTEFFMNVDDDTLDVCYFTDKIDILERRILAHLHSELLAESNTVAFLAAFFNAALIYIYEDLRTCPRWTNCAIALSTRIMSGMSLVVMTGVIEAVPDLLLWTLLLGRSGIPPIECPNTAWYAEEIAAATQENREMKIPPVVSGLRYFELSEAVRPRQYVSHDEEKYEEGYNDGE